MACGSGGGGTSAEDEVDDDAPPPVSAGTLPPAGRSLLLDAPDPEGTGFSEDASA